MYITHSFRSIPMLAVVVLNYAKALKQIKISGIYYGAFEALGPISKVKEMEPEERIAPILDLTPLDALMEWSFAIDRYIGTGDARPVSSLTISSANEILKETNLPLFRRLKSQVARFRGDDVLDGVEAAKWCLEHNLVQQAYTILEETIISYMVKSIGRDIHDRTNREIATQSLRILRENMPFERWQPPASEKRDLTEAFCRCLMKNPGIRKQMDALTQYRNDLNHAGYTKSPIKPERFSKKLREILSNIEMVLGGQKIP